MKAPFLSCALAILLSAPPLLAGAADAPKTTVAQVAAYQGPDREARLVQGAKAEGEVSLYFSHPVVRDIAAAFEQKYGVKVKLWRAGNEAIMQRLMAESRSGRDEADLFFGSTVDTEAAARADLLAPVSSVLQKDIVDGGVAPNRTWTTWGLDIWTTAYNTNLVKKEDLPKTYEDLADPKWKGKLGVEVNDHQWYGLLLSRLGEERGRKIFSQITANNGISVHKGHSLVTKLVAAGEIPFALTVYSWNPGPLQRKGAPIEAHFLEPLVGTASAVGVLKNAQHPNAAILFYDFMLSEGQKILAEAGYVPASKKFDLPVKKYDVKLIEPGEALRQQERWQKMFEEDIVKKAK